MVKVTVNGICREYRSPVTYEQLAGEHQKEYDHRIVLAVANNKIRELYKNVAKDVTVTFQTTADRIGHDTCVRSACMLMLKAVSDVSGSMQEGKASVNSPSAGGISACPRETWPPGWFPEAGMAGSGLIPPLWSR